MLRQRLTLAIAFTISAVAAGCYVDASQDQCGHADVGELCFDNHDCSEGLLCGDDSFCEEDPGLTSGGSGAGEGSGSGSGGASSGGSEPMTCGDHSDCNEGFFCEAGECQPGAIPCADLQAEEACADRADCEPVYAGVNCSCGPNCQCEPGEPGCVCESFEYFACSDSQ